jgi:hypothetical protein
MLWWTLRQLKSRDRKTRLQAVKKLGQSGGGPRVVEALVGALKDEHTEVQRAAAEALGQTIDPLVAALKDGNKDMRKAAVQTLGKIKDPRAVEPLLCALKDKEGIVRTAAVSALESIGWQPGDRKSELEFAVARKDWKGVVKYGMECGQDGCKALLQAAASLDDSDMARTAHDALVSLGGEAVAPILDILKRDLGGGLGERLGLPAMVVGVKLLGSLGDARAVELLADVLEHFARSWNVALEDPEFFNPEAIHAIFQKAIWETVVALIGCGEPGVKGLVKGVEAAENALESEITGLGVSTTDLAHTVGKLGKVRCELEAMVFAPLAAIQLKIAPETRNTQLAQAALAELKKVARTDTNYKSHRVLQIVSSVAGVPVTEEMIR